VRAVLVAHENVRGGDTAGGQRDCVEAGFTPVGVLDRSILCKRAKVPDADRDLENQQSEKAGGPPTDNRVDTHCRIAGKNNSPDPMPWAVRGGLLRSHGSRRHSVVREPTAQSPGCGSLRVIATREQEKSRASAMGESRPPSRRFDPCTMKNSEREQSPPRWPKARVEAISDGVFAIAITLLVIEIKISPSEFRHLEHALVHEWPGYLANVTSFLTIGGVWISHHTLFTRAQFVDASMLVINLVLLMGVAFLPFPTGVLAQALNSPAEAQHAAIVFYGVSVIAVELLLGALGYYADQRSRVTVDRQPESIRSQTQLRRRRVTASTIAYTVAMGVRLLVPDLAAVAYLVIAIALLAATVHEARAIPRPTGSRINRGAVIRLQPVRMGAVGSV
jgi:uncharacterized membrane protein